MSELYVVPHSHIFYLNKGRYTAHKKVKLAMVPSLNVFSQLHTLEVSFFSSFSFFDIRPANDIAFLACFSLESLLGLVTLLLPFFGVFGGGGGG